MDVIIYQSGFSHCLRYCVESLRVHSPRSRVIIIGENVPDFECVNEQPYHEAYDKFLPTYVHHSPNPPDFELRCLRRWMVIAEYVRTTDIKEYVCFDSDVMCFCDLSETLKTDQQFSFYSPHASFAWVHDRQGMEHFVEKILWVYANKDSAEWKAMENDFLYNRRPVVGDMNMMDWFMSSQPSQHLGLVSPHGRQDVFDRNICETFDFMAHGDRKRIFFLDGQPYALTSTRHVVRMNTLHCWGPYKPRMDEIWNLSRYSVGKPEPVPWR